MGTSISQGEARKEETKRGKEKEVTGRLGGVRRQAGVMPWGLRVATRQATERSGVQGLGRTDELPGGLTSAREKGALSSVVAVFIYTHTHARARYVFLNVAHSQGTIGCPVCTA